MAGIDALRLAPTFVVTPRGRLYLTRVGFGEPLVTLHGGPGEAHDYLPPYLDSLASSERSLVYYDQAGGGRSQTDYSGSWRDHVEDLDAVRKHLGAEHLDLLGFSWGSLLALLYAREHPGRVRRLVLVSPASLIEDGGSAGAVQSAAARQEVLALSEHVARLSAAGEIAAEQARFASRIAPLLWNPARALDLRAVATNEAAARAVWSSLHQGDRERLLEVRVPTLVIVGREDPVSFPGASAVADRLGARILVLSNCGHAPFAEAPEAFLAGVRGFLGDAGVNQLRG